MHLQYTPYVFPYVITGLLLVPMVHVAWRRRQRPGAAALVVTMVAVIGWCVGNALEIASVELGAKLLWANIEYIGIVTIPTAWWVFSVYYSGQENWFTPRRWVGLVIVPAVTLILVWTNDLHGLMRQGVLLDTSGPFSTVEKSYGPWFWLWVAYTYTLLLLSTLLLGRALAGEFHLYRGQSVALGCAIFFPWFANFLYVMELNPLPKLDPTPIAFGCSGLVWTWALSRYRLMDIVPIARDAVLENMCDGVVVLDTSNHVVDLNPAARSLLGAGDGSIGRKAEDVLGACHELRGCLESAEEKRLEVRVGEAPEERRCDTLVSPLLDRRGHLRGRLVVLRDITEVRRAQRERRRLESRVQQAQRLESLGVLAAGVAHTFNNLLVGILGNSNLALMFLPEESPARERLQQLEKAAQQAAEITRQMLVYSGKGHFVISHVHLTRLAREMAPLLEAVLGPKVSIRYDLDPETPVIRADEGQMRQILLNLVTNASEALDESGGTILVGIGAMQVDSSLLSETFPGDRLPEGRYAFLRVSDNGCGMDAAMQTRIFEPFFSTKFAGRGLGLAAVLGIVRGHGGTIRVESEPGKGSSFLILLPPVPSQETPPRDGHGEEPE